jgi:hypothetical protein
MSSDATDHHEQSDCVRAAPRGPPGDRGKHLHQVSTRQKSTNGVGVSDDLHPDEVGARRVAEVCEDTTPAADDHSSGVASVNRPPSQA